MAKPGQARVRKPGRAQLASLAGAGVLMYVLFSAVGALVAGAVLRLPGLPPWAGSLAQLILVPFSLLPPIIMMGTRGFKTGLWLPLNRGRIPVYILLPLFLGIMVAVNSCANLLRGLLTRNLDLPAAQSAALPEDGTARALYFVAACILAPVLEELFFRGALQGALWPFGSVMPIVFSSLFFMLAHANLWELPVVFVLGFIIGYVAEVSGSLLPGMVLHAANNTTMFIILLQQGRKGGIATLALAFWMVLLFVALFIAAVWGAGKMKLWPKFRLKRSPAPKKPAPGKPKPVSPLRYLLRQPVFLAGLLVAVAYCVVRLFTG